MFSGEIVEIRMLKIEGIEIDCKLEQFLITDVEQSENAQLPIDVTLVGIQKELRNIYKSRRFTCVNSPCFIISITNFYEFKQYFP